MKSKKGNKPVKQGFPGFSRGVMIAAIALMVVLSACQSAQAGTQSLPAEMTVAQAAEQREQGAFMLDVRQPEEWDQVHMPGATLIPLGELPNRLNEVPKDKPVVVVCRSGNRSQQGRDILLNAGFSEVTSMAGGMNDWQAQGLPVETGK